MESSGTRNVELAGPIAVQEPGRLGRGINAGGLRRVCTTRAIV
jgi:hypothetical protein